MFLCCNKTCLVSPREGPRKEVVHWALCGHSGCRFGFAWYGGELVVLVLELELVLCHRRESGMYVGVMIFFLS